MIGSHNRRLILVGGGIAVAALALLTVAVFRISTTHPATGVLSGSERAAAVEALASNHEPSELHHSNGKSHDKLRQSSASKDKASFDLPSETETSRRFKTALLSDEVDDSPTESKRPKKMRMPEWDLIFSPGGTLKDEVDDMGAKSSNGVPDYVDLYGGIRADFIQDNLSNGIATDMSALLGAVDISSEVLYNGEVSPEHDLGNAYFLVSRNLKGETQVFVGIERLFVSMDSFIEVEFNQGHIQLGSGTGWWQISGERMDGDLLVRINFVGGRVSNVEFEVWQAGGYNLLKTANGSPGRGCNREVSYVYCGGIPPISHSPEDLQVWDANFNLLEPTYPNDFVQIGINIERLTGQDLPFSGVLLRTPQDIAINRFFRPNAERQAQRSETRGRNLFAAPLNNDS